MINRFADATDDHQFLHVDPERAAKEGPFGGTIAHGFLTVSLLSTLAYEALPMIEGATMGINYGFDKLRFMSPVKAGARVRARFKLADLDIRPSGRVMNTYEVALEVEGLIKPAFHGDMADNGDGAAAGGVGSSVSRPLKVHLQISHIRYMIISCGQS